MPRKNYISPNIKVYGPVSLERERTTDRQIRRDEETIIWGDYDDLPLRIMNAVNRSPTAASCLSTKETFITGSGFTDEGLMTMPIDKDGTTLWDFHTQLTPYLTNIEAFAVNFKFDRKARITNSYVMGAESCRFTKPQDKSKKITEIKFNPYFGTKEYNPEFTTRFPVFDIGQVPEQVKIIDDEYEGQMFFFGTVKPPYKFYPVPKYWGGEHWISVDAGIQEFHKSNLENGFFQSALMNVIGNPNQPSKNPKYQKEVTGTDNVKRKQSTKTVGEEFDDEMSEKFSGGRKAGTAMVLWSLNKDQAVNIQAFPSNVQFGLLSGTFTDAIKGICIATEVDPILLAIQGNGLVNSGDSIRAVIEYMQSKVVRQHKILETFYNKIMLPNLQTRTKGEVKIKNYSPISLSVTVEEKFWNVLSDQEKKEFVKKSVPGMQEIIKDEQVTTDPETGEPLSPVETQLNEKIADLSGLQIIRMQSIARKFNKGEITLDQAKLLLKNFGLDELEINTWLGITEEAVTP